MRNDALSLDVQSYVLSLTSATLSTSQLQTLTNLSSCIGGCSALIDASVADLRPATTCALDDPVPATKPATQRGRSLRLTGMTSPSGPGI
jgi:hypothetical protein